MPIQALGEDNHPYRNETDQNTFVLRPVPPLVLLTRGMPMSALKAPGLPEPSLPHSGCVFADAMCALAVEQLPHWHSWPRRRGNRKALCGLSKRYAEPHTKRALIPADAPSAGPLGAPANLASPTSAP